MLSSQSDCQERCGNNEKAKHEKPTTKKGNHEMHESRAGLEAEHSAMDKEFLLILHSKLSIRVA